ncbi:MAG: glycosyltransferase family 4 protein [Bifidobacteriaceae bacterium]|nr:glycosyltransferase family 4 protein [Bifidobacteriaceae bacterium]
MSEQRRPAGRVAHVSSVHVWTDNRVHYREAASLARAGHAVALIAVDGPVQGPPAGVRVVKLPRRGRLRRLALGGVQAVRTAWALGPDVFHLHDPELAWAAPLLRAAGRKVVYDAHEDFPAQVKNKPYLAPWAVPLAVAGAHLALALARRANHIVAATETIARRFPPAKTTVVRNYPPLRPAEAAAPPLAARRAAAVYIGAVSAIRGAAVMAQAAASPLFPPAWRLRVAGRLRGRAAQALAGRPGQVDYLGELPPEAARDLLLDSRVGLVLFGDTAAHRDALPTKMFEYLAAGLPVIASDFPLWRQIIGRHEAGQLVDQTDPAAVARAIARYAADPELLKLHGANARRLAVSQLNWASEEAALAAVYRSLLAA